MADVTELMDLNAAEELLNMRGLLHKLRRNGSGPPYLKLSPKVIRYTRSELLEWVNGIKVIPTNP